MSETRNLNFKSISPHYSNVVVPGRTRSVRHRAQALSFVPHYRLWCPFLDRWDIIKRYSKDLSFLVLGQALLSSWYHRHGLGLGLGIICGLDCMMRGQNQKNTERERDDCAYGNDISPITCEFTIGNVVNMDKRKITMFPGIRNHSFIPSLTFSQSPTRPTTPTKHSIPQST